MRELHIAPGDVFRIAVEEDDRGPRVIIRMGNGRWRPLSAARARSMAELLNQAANDVDAARIVDVPVEVISGTGTLGSAVDHG